MGESPRSPPRLHRTVLHWLHRIVTATGHSTTPQPKEGWLMCSSCARLAHTHRKRTADHLLQLSRPLFDAEPSTFTSPTRGLPTPALQTKHIPAEGLTSANRLFATAAVLPRHRTGRLRGLPCLQPTRLLSLESSLHWQLLKDGD